MSLSQITDYLNPNHKDFFQYNSRELLFYGGASAGKSYSVVDKIILNSVRWSVPTRSIIIRKTLPSLKKTCIPLAEKRLKLFGIPYKYNRQDQEIFLPNGSKIEFVSMNNKVDYEKIKSITDVDLIWIEEVNELQEDGYEETKRRLRGGKGNFAQLITTCNPISRFSWVYDRFFIRNVGNIGKIKKTVLNNPWAEKEYINDLQELEQSNYNMYLIYFKGEWGELKGTIYQNYQTVSTFPEDVQIQTYGTDFGWNVPSAVVEIGNKENNFYIREKIYQTQLTTPNLIERFKSEKMNPSLPNYCDNEPKVIDEIYRAGFNAKPGDKDVYAGLIFCQGKKLFVDESSTNLLKELQSYSWQEDKMGNPVDQPVKFNDHLCDAMRYGIFTHFRNTSKSEIKQRPFFYG